MKTNQNDLLVMNLINTEIILSTKQDDKNKIKPCLKEPEQEGSLQTIEQPQEHNDNTILKTEAQIEEAENNKKSTPRIPFDFFSLEQQNRTKYIY